MFQNDFALTSRRVIVGSEMRPATVIIRGGIIEEVVLVSLQKHELPVEDVGDLIVMPGLVDTHVHINEPGRSEWEGFETATQSAAAGGITSVVDMPLNCSPVTTSAEALARKIESLAGKLWIDCGFWGGVIPSSLGNLAKLLEAGVLGVKSFTIDSGIDEFPSVEEAHIRHAIRTLAGYHVPYLIHAEVDRGGQESSVIGTSYRSFLESRPCQWENDAIAMLIRLCQEARDEGIDAHMHIVHLSSADALASIAEAKENGLPLTAESCPHYLTLCAEDIPDGQPLFKCCPPIRGKANQERLWQGLIDHVVDFIVSDHSPCSPKLRLLDTGDIEQAWGGISSLQFGLSLIWTEAKKRGVDLNQVIDWMSTRPAQFAGLGDCKGRLASGYDADFVVFDDAGSYVIQPEIIKYRHKVTPYEGRLVHGVVEATYVRGQKVYSDGNFSDAPVGKPILRNH
jgi:allantoinase